jgi:DNA-binding response OmpR family regulator
MADILVVDDDPEVRLSINHILNDEGHTVSAASSGQQALDIIARQRPDMVILDILMPDFDGIELCRRIRANPFRAPGGSLDQETDHLVVGDLRLYKSLPEVEVNGQLVELTAIEHRLLHSLMLHAPQPMSTGRLLEDVWEYPPGVGDPNVVRACIVRLRAKIEPKPEAPQYLRNTHGRGYLIGD